MTGSHVAKAWSSTQPNLVWPPGEAGYYGLAKAAGVALGYQALLWDVGADSCDIAGRQLSSFGRHVAARSGEDQTS